MVELSTSIRALKQCEELGRDAQATRIAEMVHRKIEKIGRAGTATDAIVSELRAKFASQGLPFFLKMEGEVGAEAASVAAGQSRRAWSEMAKRGGGSPTYGTAAMILAATTAIAGTSWAAYELLRRRHEGKSVASPD